MKFLTAVKKFFNIAFALYTCVSFGMMICNRVLGIEQAPTWGGVALLFGQIGLFSAICALSITVIDLPKKLNSALAHILKFICCYGAFYLCFFALVDAARQPVNIVVISTVFVILYALIAVIAGIFARLASRSVPEKYESIYTKE